MSEYKDSQTMCLSVAAKISKEMMPIRFIYTIEGYIRIYNKIYIPQPLIDLILFFYINLKMGNEINLGAKKGRIKFLETTHWSENECVLGIELNEWSPNATDGTVDGKRYFEASEGKGFFVRKQSFNNLIDLLNDHPQNEILRRDSVFIQDTSSLNIGLGRVFDMKCVHISSKPKPKIKSLWDFPKLGDRVKTVKGKIGIVRYIGTTSWAKGIVIGIELNEWWPNGHDGRVKKIRYFSCGTGRGYFTRLSHLIENFGPPLNNSCSEITKGAYAILKGLIRVPKFNGKTVQIVAYVEKQGRWKVKLLHAKQEKKYLGVREENLDPIIYW